MVKECDFSSMFRCFIIVRTGYSKHWNDVLKYAGVESEEQLLHTNEMDINDQLHWPCRIVSSKEFL